MYYLFDCPMCSSFCFESYFIYLFDHLFCLSTFPLMEKMNKKNLFVIKATEKRVVYKLMKWWCFFFSKQLKPQRNKENVTSKTKWKSLHGSYEWQNAHMFFCNNTFKVKEGPPELWTQLRFQVRPLIWAFLYWWVDHLVHLRSFTLSTVIDFTCILS